jgi:CRISPR-associated protein Cmr4
MFEAAQMMYFYVETPLHAGTGRALGAVDLPIQRERVSELPMVQSNGIKGKLRAMAESKNGQGHLRMTADDVKLVFGPDTANASEHAGALAPTDARLLLFPVRSLAGVFAWTTSQQVLQRFARDLVITGGQPTWVSAVDDIAKAATPGCCAVSDKALMIGNQVVLEEYTFKATESASLKTIGQWLADTALPATAEYAYWRGQLPNQLVLLPDDAFRDFTQFATEIQTHIKIDQQKKTVQEGALWVEEYLPTDTLLYSMLCATPARNGTLVNGPDVLQKVRGMNLNRMQLGGDETTGHGIVAVRL